MGRLIKQLIRRTQVLTDFVCLGNHVSKKPQILVLIAYEMMDGYVARLPVPIDAAVALFEARWIPWAIEVEQISGGTLEIQPLRCGIRCDQHTYRIGRIIKRILHISSFVIVEAAEQEP